MTKRTVIQLRVTAEEKAQIEAAAAKDSTTITKFILRRCLAPLSDSEPMSLKPAEPQHREPDTTPVKTAPWSVCPRRAMHRKGVYCKACGRSF